jgi:predicted ester cyclase
VRVIGTQSGPCRGRPASGQRADFTAIGIDRFRGDLVVERSAWSDLADLVCQRGHQTLTVPPVAEP